MILRRAQFVAPLALVIASCALTGRPATQSGVTDGGNVGTAITGATKPVSTKERGKVITLSFEDFYALHQSNKALLYDARLAFFYKLGHIPGAINLSKNSSDAAIAAKEPEIKAALTHGKTIVIYCTDIQCPDARKLADRISIFGYPVAVFTGGWHAWHDAEMPTE